MVQRTGWGKSAVYFVATALLRNRHAGPTVIVSPLLALMRNQIAAAEGAGIRAATINSANVEDWEAVHRRIDAGAVDVLLVSPERLNNPDFRDRVLPRLAAAAGLLVVDEAHCISDWGHDFRPDYRRLRTLLAELPDGIPVLATTATANERVTADVAEQLGIHADRRDADVLVLRGSLDRQSLHLSVVDLPDQAHRLAWLAEHLDGLRGSGIIYTLTVAATVDVADHLRAHGYEVAAYSGQTEQAERLAAEEALLANRVKALVATSALGMGFDKPDLGFVIHLGAPPSPIAYYQQVGRAGRAVDRAEVILLPGREDRAVWDYFASLAFPPEAQVRETLATLDRHGAPMSTAALETRVDLRRTRLEAMLKVLDVDGALRRVRGGWQATGRPWRYDADRYARVAEARGVEQRAMLDYIATTGCRMRFLRAVLDDPEASPCGRCDNCRGTTVATNLTEAAVAGARERITRPGVSVEPRRQWPTGMPALGMELKGRIAADEQAAQGRALGRLSDLGWGPRLRTLLDESTPDREVSDDLVDALVGTLAAWDWDDRPCAIVSVASHTRPRLVASVATRLAELGRLPYLGALASTRAASPPRRVNSAQRLAAVAGAFAVPADLGAALPRLGGAPVLLVDDRADSGWTLAVAARLLRRAGAGPVLPLVLAAER